LQERRVAGRVFRIVCHTRHEYGDAPPRRLLGASRARPSGRRAAEQHEDLPSP
jgi:hypothetical protein